MMGTSHQPACSSAELLGATLSGAGFLSATWPHHQACGNSRSMSSQFTPAAAKVTRRISANIQHTHETQHTASFVSHVRAHVSLVACAVGRFVDTHKPDVLWDYQ